MYNEISSYEMKKICKQTQFSDLTGGDTKIICSTNYRNKKQTEKEENDNDFP